MGIKLTVSVIKFKFHCTGQESEIFESFLIKLKTLLKYFIFLLFNFVNIETNLTCPSLTVYFVSVSKIIHSREYK